MNKSLFERKMCEFPIMPREYFEKSLLFEQYMHSQYKFFHINVETGIGNTLPAGYSDVIVKQKGSSVCQIRKLYIF